MVMKEIVHVLRERKRLALKTEGNHDAYIFVPSLQRMLLLCQLTVPTVTTKLST